MPLLGELNADRYVVYGVVTEICVRFAAFGLLKSGKQVEIVTDAIKALDDATAGKMFAEFSAAGGYLSTAAEVR
jgi:nicotinamidase/pyrazinamidase